MIYFLYVLWGTLVGVISGCIGLGGGVVIVPSLVLFFGLNQLQAQGTSVALMIPPIGLLAAIKYYQEGNVVIPIAAGGAIGVFFGAFFGAALAHYIGGPMMQKVFAVVLIATGFKMLVS
ncbi:MAG: sulfite exporter TauE/SafE family protein [Candidatus Rifleibacteriota bacterium]